MESNDELGYLSEQVNSMSRELKDKELMKETFGKVVDPAVRDYLLQGNLSLGGEEREVTVLFSDIRISHPYRKGFRLSRLATLLNRYFEKMSRCISEHQGLVNKYIGDAIMAVFGAPLPTDDHAHKALAAARQMIAEREELALEFETEGLPRFHTGIGIHTGPVVAGNIGSSNRMEYTVIGDTVNLASRLESATKDLEVDILFTAATSERLTDLNRVSLGMISVRGRAEPVEVFSLR